MNLLHETKAVGSSTEGCFWKELHGFILRALPTTFRSANIRATWSNVSNVAPYAENRATINVMYAETTTYADLRI